MEIFKTIDGYDNYKISNYGNVINDTMKRILKPQISCHGYFYVSLYINGKKKIFPIHRLVGLHFCENKNNYDIVDHIDRDITNNCYDNLRWVTKSQNSRNIDKKKNTSSKYRGVHFDKARQKWRAQFKLNGKGKYLGLFDTEEEAYEAFKNKIIEHNLQEFYPDL